MSSKVVFIFLFFALTVNGNDLSPKERKAVDLLGAGIEKFSWHTLLRTFIDYPEENVVLSPFSIWSMLSVLSEGAGGNSLNELSSVLRHSPNFTQIVRDGYKGIMRTYNSLQDVQLYTINTIFYDMSTKIEKKYDSLIKQLYSTQIIPMSFSHSSATSYINKIVYEMTKKKIKNIVNSDDLKDASLMMTNAIYFKGLWTHPFMKQDTKKTPFYNENKEVIGEVNMMHAKSNFIHVKSAKLLSDIIVLPFGKKEQLSMLLIIPEVGVKLNDVYRKFEQFHFKDLFAEYLNNGKSKNQQIEVYMPRLTITTDLVMNQILNNMGLYDVFSPDYAELPDISSDLYLSRVIHKTKIEITEEGSVSVDDRFDEDKDAESDESVKVVANKPFMFVVIDDFCKSIVVGGLYRKPQLF